MSSQDEASASIDKLRAVLKRLRQLAYPIDSYIYGASVVIIHAPYEPDAWTPKPGQEVFPENIRRSYVLCHEGIHMAQTLTCPFVLAVADDYSQVVHFVRRNVRQGKPESSWLPKAQRRLVEVKTRLQTGPVDGFSPQHIIEAQAVLEGFRGAFSRHIQEGLITIIQIAHNLDGLYSELIGRSLNAYGFEFTLAVLPRLCWLALQGNTPGETLLMCLEILTRHYEIGEVIGWKATELCLNLGMDPVHLAEALPKRWPACADTPLKPILDPYWRRFEEIKDPEISLQASMHPGKSSGGIGIQDILPPVTIFDENVVHTNGPHKDRGWDAAAPLIGSAGVQIETLVWLEERRLGGSEEIPPSEPWLL